MYDKLHPNHTDYCCTEIVRTSQVRYGYNTAQATLGLKSDVCRDTQVKLTFNYHNT